MQYQLPYYESYEAYLREIFLDSSFIPGEYSIQVTIEAVGYVSLEIEIPLTILEKDDYDITLQVDSEIDAGDTLRVTVIVMSDGSPVDNVSITVHVTITFRDGSQTTSTATDMTNHTGMLQVAFDIPTSVSELEIIASYDGSISAWPSDSEPASVDVIPVGVDVLSMILGLLVNPISWAAIGTAGAAAYIVKRKRVPATELSSVASMASSAVPSPPVTDIQKLQDLLRANPEGLSRKEISENLSLSSSKVGDLVRDLLSDEQYYEWREGTRRLIRFKE